MSNVGEQHVDEYADLQIEVDGKLGCLAALASQRAQFPHLKIILSIGGGGEGSANFAAVAASATARMAFAQSAKEFVERFEFNGIDSKSNLGLEKSILPLIYAIQSTGSIHQIQSKDRTTISC